MKSLLNIARRFRKRLIFEGMLKPWPQCEKPYDVIDEIYDLIVLELEKGKRVHVGRYFKNGHKCVLGVKSVRGKAKSEWVGGRWEVLRS